MVIIANMDLKQFLPDQEKKSSEEHFWALIIEPGWVQAGIWRIEEDTAKVISGGAPTAWELDEDLISAADTALTVSLQNFPEDLQEPSKTVFGLISSWVTGGQIKPEYLEKIKKICTELSLTPVGFVVLPEAIAHFLRSEEGSSINAVILGVYKEILEISVFKLGNLLGTSQVARSVSIVDDVSEGLSRFTAGDAVPSRFILYNGKEGELEEVRQALLKVNWEDFENLKFLHTPKIEIVDSQKKTSAVSLAGASELADVISIETVQPALEEEKEGEMEEGPPTPEGPTEKKEEASPQDLGFELEKDVAETAKGSRVPTGFSEELTEEDYAVSNIVPVESEKSARAGGASVISGKIAWLPQFVKGIFSKFDSLGSKAAKGGFAGTGKRTLIFGLGFLLLILAAILLFWLFFPKAAVTIYVSPQKLDERAEITINPGAHEVDLSQRILPGEELKTTSSGEKTKSTSGTKTVGDKAKGEITLYRVGPNLALPSETTLYGPDDMKFSLDESVAIASGSASSPGTTKAPVTAEDIGAQYNLAAGASFKVGNYSVSDIEARNESAFSGGSSREISAVSAEDQEALEKDLEEELKDKAANKFKEDLAGDKVFISGSLTATASSRTFSNKVGDEASDLKLSLTLDSKALAVNKKELLDLAGEVLKDKVPKGFILRGEQISVDFGSESQEEGVYKFSAAVAANLLPEIDPDEVAKKIAGKYPSLAEDFLIKEVPGFVRAEIKLRPHLPGRLGNLPRIAKHIEVVISAER